jgi:enoyl-CoA hydratase/carnithine racemase
MDLPVPTFAFVNGAAMGGGVEIALACDYRTISGGVPAFALPETFLGLVPGWGGCYLLPNLIGPAEGAQGHHREPDEQNRMLKARRWLKLGIADAMFAPADFLEDSLRGRPGRLAGRDGRAPAVDRDEARLGCRRRDAPRTGRRQDRRVFAGALPRLELVRAARTATRAEAFAAEDEALADLIMGDELRAGLYSFDLVQKRAKRPAGAPDKALARPVTKVGIVGAGLMASQLALLFASAWRCRSS